MKKRVMITGAAGLIGGILIDKFKESYDLVLMDRVPVGHLESVVANITDLDVIRDAFSGVDTVLHLAAEPDMNAKWGIVLKDNIITTYNVFEASRLEGVKNIIFASSNHAVGMWELKSPEFPLHLLESPPSIDHTVQPRPDGYYGVSKCFGEALGRFYSDEYGIGFIGLRIGTVTKEDDPTENPRWRSTWLSHRDLAHLFGCCLNSEGIEFDIFYGISGNTRRFWDLGHARDIIGYDPEDDAESFY